MITDLKLLLALGLDKLAEAVAPLKNAIPLTVLGGQDDDYQGPVGEHPDLGHLMNVPAGVEQTSFPGSAGGHLKGQSLLELPVAADIADRHTRRLDLRSGDWVCGCSQTFALQTAWAIHVLDLIEGVIATT